MTPKNVLTIVAICLSVRSMGQVPISNLQTLEYGWINPAMNSRGSFSMAAGYSEMKQWRGISSAQLPLGNGRTSIGYVMYANPGVMSATACGPTVAHRFQVADSLVIGVSFKPYYFSRSFDYSGYVSVDPNDPMLNESDGLQAGHLMADIGASISFRALYGGINVVNIADSELDLGTTTRPNDCRGYVAIVGARPKIGSLTLDVSVAHINTSALETTTFSCIGNVKMGALFGTGYRSADKGLMLFSGFQIRGLGRWTIGGSRNEGGSYSLDSAILVDIP